MNSHLRYKCLEYYGCSKYAFISRVNICKEILSDLKEDFQLPKKYQQYGELYFLLNKSSTKFKQWIVKALLDYSSLEFQNLQLPKNLFPIDKCLWICKFRKDRLQYIKDHDGSIPTHKQIVNYCEFGIFI